MNAADFVALLPLITIAATAIVVMIAIAIRRNHKASIVISLLGVSAALADLPLSASAAPRQITSLLVLDSYSRLYMAILLGAAGFVFLFAYDYLKRRQERPEEFYLLVLLATTGAMVLVVSRNFASFFLGLELLSVALYSLIAYVRTESASIEAGIKYLILAASSSSILLFGLALIYAGSGSMELDDAHLWAHEHVSSHDGPDARTHGHRFQAGGRSISTLDAGCLRRRTPAGNGVHCHRIEGRNVCISFALVPRA